MEEIPVQSTTQVPSGTTALALVRDAAMALAQAEVVRFRGDPALAAFNARHGVASLRTEPRCEQVPGFTAAKLDEAALLARAFAWAAHEARTHVDPGDTRALLVRAFASRRLIYPALIAAARAGALDPASFASIRKAMGGLALARACIDGARMMRSSALAGKNPVPAAVVDEAERIGERLLDVLRPTAARNAPSHARREKRELRDRVWTLLARSHDYLRRVGLFVYGAAVDERVPRLLASRHARPRRRAAAPQA